MEFGNYIREKRNALREENTRFSLRQVADRVELEPAYLSKIERNEVRPPSENKIRKIAKELDEDPDVLLALAGKVGTELQEIIRRRPKLFSDLIRELKDMPEAAILRVVREVRDGEW